MSEPFVPTTASNFQERWVIVCVNPANSDDKMEFASVVELNAELFRLKAEVERLRKAIDEADDKLKLLAEWAVVCEVESAQVNQVRDILRHAAKEGKPSDA